MIINQIKSINYKLLFVLILSGFIPLIYSTTRIHLLGTMPDAWAFSIAAQVAWLNVGYEVLSEALLIPLAFLLGQVISEKRAYQTRVSTSLLIVLVFYLVATAFVLFLTPKLVTSMQQEASLIMQTSEYIRLESIAILLSSVFSFFHLILVLKDKQSALYLLLGLQVALTLLGDSVFVSQLPFSFSLGVNGIAVTNICVNLCLSILCLVYLSKENIGLRYVRLRHQKWIKDWLNIGCKSGLESFVRNLAFSMMILKLMNEVQQADIYWITNQFIWGWLLLPSLALGQLIKQDTATHHGLTSEKINAYLVLSALIISLWLISMPLWHDFITTVMGISASVQVVQLATLLIGFYALFALNHVIDSYFYGLGRTDLMLYQSLIINTFFYGSAYISYHIGLFIPSLESIALMFGFGLLFDTFLTFSLYFFLRKRESKRLISKNTSVKYQMQY